MEIFFTIFIVIVSFLSVSALSLAIIALFKELFDFGRKNNE